MKVSSSVLHDSVNDFIDEMFMGFEMNIINALNKTGAKLYVDSNLHNMLKPFLDEDSSLDIDKVQEYLMPEIKKLKTVVIPAGPTRYKLDEADFQKLFAKIKQNATDHQ